MTSPPDDGDVNQCMDFQGSDHFNVGTCDDKPDEYDPFGFSGIGFAQFQLGVELADVCGVSAPKKPKSGLGIELADVKSGRGGRLTLEWWKCYLDSCASYHTFFLKEFLKLKNIQESEATMTGRCNTVTTRTNKRGSYEDFKVWLNEKGITNLISIPMLEASGHTVSTHIKGEWKVVTPEGDTITFKRDTGLCAGMPYIDLREHKEGFVLPMV